MATSKSIKSNSKSWRDDARKVTREINYAIAHYPGQYVYGRTASGEWVRITRAKAIKIEIFGHCLATGQWIHINQWEVR